MLNKKTGIIEYEMKMRGISQHLGVDFDIPFEKFKETVLSLGKCDGVIEVKQEVFKPSIPSGIVVSYITKKTVEVVIAKGYVDDWEDHYRTVYPPGY